jgi:hypothetical protein
MMDLAILAAERSRWMELTMEDQRVTEISQGCMDDAASAEELLDEPCRNVAGGSGDAHPAHLSLSEV